ncbi:MAG: hypothetical protein ATN35_04110 [Epulopiscium sp. Nele67-Bin004]|nr:MAG: hypothetical protein ATN35_04110 [Epulopiscium sp. Nele67-Bin004]
MKKLIFMLGLLAISPTIYASSLYTIEEAGEYAKAKLGLSEELQLEELGVTTIPHSLNVFSLVDTSAEADIFIDIEENGRIIKYKYVANDFEIDELIFEDDVDVTEPEESVEEIEIVVKAYTDLQLKTVADRFINYVSQTYNSTLQSSSTYPTTRTSDTITFYYEEIINGLPVAYKAASVTVSLETCEVIEFLGVPTYLGSYADVKINISEQDAYQKYFDNVTLGTMYKLYEDDNGNIRATAIYGHLPTSFIGVSSTTNEIVNMGLVSDVANNLPFAYSVCVEIAQENIYNEFGINSSNLLLIPSKITLNTNVYTYTFLRFENKLPVINNFIEVEVDAITSECNIVSREWHEDVVFSSLGGRLTTDYINQLKETFFENAQVELSYLDISSTQKIPAYILSNCNYFINALTFEAIN